MAQRTITSPGVEIRESDLSLTTPQNIGTNCYVTGFAQQGPLDEVLKITSKQELNQIFGVPTNSAERYFYYTISELLNSPANVYATRIPYGEGTGDGFGSKYSALVYPTRLVSGSTGSNTLCGTVVDFNKDIIFSDFVQAVSGTYITLQLGDGTSYSVGFSGYVGPTGSETLLGGVTSRPTGDRTNPDWWVNFSHAAGFSASPFLTGGNAGPTGYHTGGTNTIGGAISAFAETVRLSSRSATGGSGDGLGYHVHGGGSGEAGPVVEANIRNFTNVLNHTVTFTLTAAATNEGAQTVIQSITPAYEDPGDTWTLALSTNQQIRTTLDVLSGTYVLGNPTHLELTEGEYLSALEGTAWDWSTEASLQNSFSAIGSSGGAGAVLLNKSTSTINDQFEGYYVGIADNTNLNPASDFDGILRVKTIDSESSTVSSYVTIPDGILQFSVSANYQTGAANSISEVMENLTDYDINGREDDDVLNLGVFKLRKSIYATEAFKLDYVLEDGIVGSVNQFRTQLNPNGGLDVPFFIERKDTTSRNVSIKINDYITNRLRGTDALDTDGNPIKKIRVLTQQLTANTDSTQTGIDENLMTGLVDVLGKADNLYPLGAYTNSKVTNKLLGNVPTKLERALDAVKNDDIYDIDVVCEGGLGTIYSVACAAASGDYYDEFDTSESVLAAFNGLRTSGDISGTALTLRNNYNTIFNKLEQFCSPPYLGGGRGDCILIADPLRQIFVLGDESKVLDNTSRNFQKDLYWPIRHQFESQNTSYAATYANWALVYDDYSGQQVWVPFSGFAGAIMARTDAATFPWFAPAGFNRGLVLFANDIAVNPNQKQRDELYKANLNPVAFFPSQGQVVFGQKTLSKKPSAFDRINVRRLFLALERPTKKVSRFFVFEQNTEFTRTRIVNTLTPIFERAKNNEGLFDYLIVCDERNNTPAVIDANELVVDIYIKPTRTAEFILVNFYATRTDANFEELIGG